MVMKLLLSWRIWQSQSTADDSVWLLAVNALSSLVHADHHYQQYNVTQLCDAGIITRLLGIWKVSRV